MLPLGEYRSIPAKTLAVQPPAYNRKQQSNAADYKDMSAKYDVTRIGSRGIGNGFNLYSLERERKLGRELAAVTESDMHMVSDPIVIEYVNRLVHNLVRHSDATLPLTLRLVDRDDVNIFTLPGGFLYVNSGFLLAAESEGELAGAIAHEIAHSAARHATRSASRKKLVHAAFLPLSLASCGAAHSLIERMIDMKFSRNAEREADLLGLEYVYAAGYDPAEFVRFFERIQEQAGPEKTTFLGTLFRTHPAMNKRIRRAQKELASMPTRDAYVITTSDFDEMKARLILPPSGKAWSLVASASPPR